MAKSPLKIILFVAFVDLVSFGLIIPLQATYAERLGASGFTFGLLVGVYAAMQIIFNPLLGRLSDRIGRRPVLLISVGGSIASHALLGVADLSQSLTLLFLARTLDGITGANVATAQAYIADVTTAENRAKGMGLFGAAFGLGFVVGPGFGALLAYVGGRVSGLEHGTCWPAFGAALVSVVAFILVWRKLPEPKRHILPGDEGFHRFSFRRLAHAMTRPRLLELFTFMFIATFAFVLLEATFVYLCVDRFAVAEAGTALVFCYIGLIMVIVQGGLVGRLVPRFGEMRILTVAPFFTALGFILISGVPDTIDRTIAWVLLLGGILPMALGIGLTGPNVNALISLHASSGRQGSTLGLSQGIGSLARAIGPPIGGWLYDCSPSWPYRTGAVLLALLGFFAHYVAPRQRRAIADQHDSIKDREQNEHQ